MNKIAYIITAYKDPAHLKRLINALNFDSDFYIHIDKKVDISPFIKELSTLNLTPSIISKYIVTWGGYSQILTHKELLGAVINSGNKYERIVCISGQDYPIYSNKKIHEEFRNNPEKEFITGLNISHEEPNEIFRIINYFLVDYPFLISNPTTVKIIKKIASIAPIKLKKGNVSILGGKKCDIYFGSDWYAITFECAKYVYESLCKEKKFLRYLSTAHVPIELCINTLVFNSRFGDNAMRIPKNFALSLPGDVAFEKLAPLHYLEYRDRINVFTLADYPKILRSNKMFIRKTETGISDSLMDLIDETRNRNEEE